MKTHTSNFINHLEDEYEKSEYKALNLSQWIEGYFKKFGYELSFDRSSIMLNPAECIDLGLQKLCAAGDISDDEYSEHIKQYNWGEQKLESVLNNFGCAEQLLALIRNLDFWYCRRQEKITSMESETV